MSTFRFRADRLTAAAEEVGDRSSYAIAKRTGLSQSVVQRIRSGASEPSLGSLVALAVPYDLTLDDLVELPTPAEVSA